VPIAPAARRDASRNRAIALITLAVFAGTAARYVLSPMQELVKADLGLGDNQVALLQGMAIALPTALMSIPVGRMVDRSNRTRLMAVLALLCAAGSLLTALAQGFAAAFAARVLVAASVVAAQPAALSLVADLTDPAERGRMITLTSLGQAFGGTAAYILAGALLAWLPRLVPTGSALAALAPWRLVQMAFALTVLGAMAALLTMREPARRESLADASAATLGASLRALWAYRALLLPLAVGMVSIGMADAAAGIWAVPILTRAFHQAPADFGPWLGLLNLGASVIGAVAGGLAADLGQRARGPAGALLGAMVGAVLSVPAALFPVMASTAPFAILLGLLLAAGACVNIAATSAVMVLLPNRLRGLCISVLVAVIGLVAFGIAPVLVSVAAGGSARGDLTVPLATVGVITSLAACAAFARTMRVAGRLNSGEPI
jgi:predicted MFS family arabinose efflux permease